MKPCERVNIGAIKGESIPPGDMGKEDRKRVVLEFLENSGVALPPAAVYRNIKIRGGTFEERSVKTYLRELAEEGKVLKVDPDALEEGRVVEVDLSDQGYFMAKSVAES